jgi:cis-3-alkyl-4-acyloxetan-2-one decarboxylase
VDIWEKFWHKILRRPYRLNVAYDKGRGETLVLLHGLGQNGDKWRPLINKLNLREWRVIAPDLFGFGKSPKPEWSLYDVEEHARMVLATLRQLKVQYPVTIVGHSMGCLIASHIAATKPSRVQRLVLYQPPLFVDDPIYRRHHRLRSRYFALYTYIADRPQLAFLKNQFLRRMSRRISGLNLKEEDWPPFERSLRNTIMDQQIYRELSAVKIPTDIIHGRLDIIVTRAQIKKMFAGNKNIKLHLTNDVHDISPRAASYIVNLLRT